MLCLAGLYVWWVLYSCGSHALSLVEYDNNILISFAYITELIRYSIKPPSIAYILCHVIFRHIELD